MANKPTVAEILERPYSRSFIPDPDVGGYTALIQEFPGCIAEGETLEEANRNLERAAESWIEGCLAHGAEIPEPTAELEVSGRVLLRMPKSVHKRAVELAAAEGVSLNQFLVSAVSEKVGTSGAMERVLQHIDNRLLTALTTRATTTKILLLSQSGTYEELSTTGARSSTLECGAEIVDFRPPTP